MLLIFNVIVRVHGKKWNKYFNSILVCILFQDAAIMCSLSILICLFGYIFFSLNINSSSMVKSVISATYSGKLTRFYSNVLMVRGGLVGVSVLAWFLTLFRGIVGGVWFGHFYLNDYGLWLVILVTITCGFILLVVGLNTQTLQTLSFDYFFAIVLLIIFIPLMFFASNLLTFFFLLEVISGLILYQFVVGRDWGLLLTTRRASFFSTAGFSPNSSLTNIVFFQYWVSFFGSVLLVYSILFCFYYYGTTEFVLVNFLMNLDVRSNSGVGNSHLGLISFTLIVAFFLKLGLAPVHFYKIEIYKGLPLVTILFYTVFFFIGFFFYFCMLLTSWLQAFTTIWFIACVILVISGAVILTFLLFDVIAVRAFFAYSTIVNSLGFFILLISVSA